MQPLEIMSNAEVCKLLGFRETAELGFAIHRGRFTPNIGVAFAPGEIGNKHWIVKVYKDRLDAWQKGGTQ